MRENKDRMRKLYHQLDWFRSGVEQAIKARGLHGKTRRCCNGVDNFFSSSFIYFKYIGDLGFQDLLVFGLWRIMGKELGQKGD